MATRTQQSDYVPPDYSAAGTIPVFPHSAWQRDQHMSGAGQEESVQQRMSFSSVWTPGSVPGKEDGPCRNAQVTVVQSLMHS